MSALVLSLVLAFLGAVSARAQGPAGSGGASVEPDSVLSQTLRGFRGRQLTLEEALRLAVAAAPEMAQAQASLDAAIAVVRREKGAFDPELFADLEIRDSEVPTASVFSGADVLQDRTTSSAVGARTTLSIGTTIEASLETERTRTNNSFSSLDPEYRSTGKLELRQPLLQGFGPATGGNLSAAELELSAQRLRTAQVERRVRSNTEAQYWQLYAAERDYAVQILIVERASALLEQAQVRAEAGLVGPNQVANARVFLAQQRLALLDQQERLDATSDRLSEVLGQRPSEGERFHAVDEPNLQGNWDTALEDAGIVSLAQQRNLDLQAARADLAASEARERSARWNAFPQLDLVGSLSGNGLSGRGRDIVFGGDTLRTTLDGGVGEALDQSFSLEHPEWRAGFELRLPIGLRSGRGARDIRRAEVKRDRARISELERRLDSDVRDALRRLRHGQERLRLAREAVSAAREQVRVGLIEFESGRTTAFELVRLGADLASTQQELSRALVRTATARTDLDRLLDGFPDLSEEAR